MPSAVDELSDHGALDSQGVALGIVTADLAVRTAQDAVVAHPVRQMMREPGAALGAVVVGAGRAHHRRELVLPVDTLGAVGNPEAVLDAEARMTMHLLPGELVRADVEPAPTLRVRDEARDRHRALGHGR